MNNETVAKFLADCLRDDLSEGGANLLKLTSVHHHDEKPNMVSIETMTGDRYSFTVISY